MRCPSPSVAGCTYWSKAVLQFMSAKDQKQCFQWNGWCIFRLDGWLAGWMNDWMTDLTYWLLKTWNGWNDEWSGRGTVGPVRPLNSSSVSQQVYLQHRKCPCQFARPYIPLGWAPASGPSFLACSTLPSTIHLYSSIVARFFVHTQLYELNYFIVGFVAPRDENIDNSAMA